MDQNLEQAPHLYVDQKKRSRFTIAATVVLSLLLLSLPVGVYLTQQKTTLYPQAASPLKPAPKASLEIATTSKTESAQEKFNIEILVRSDIDEANLVVAMLKFPADYLEVESVNTEQGLVEKKIESNFNNQKGEVSIIGGIPNPGFKTVETTKDSSGHILATIYFKPKKPGSINLYFDSSSAIFRNSDNTNILEKKGDLMLTINETNPILHSSPSAILNNSQEKLKIISPKGGLVYSYFQPMQILWEPKDISKISSIDLFLNGSKLGKISSNIVSGGAFLWNPQNTLVLPYANVENTFQIVVTALDKNGNVATGSTDGPFGIITDNKIVQKIATASARLSFDNLDINGGGALDPEDLSIILSNFGRKILTNPKTDINRDGVVNELDLWMLKKSMLESNIIKE